MELGNTMKRIKNRTKVKIRSDLSVHEDYMHHTGLSNSFSDDMKQYSGKIMTIANDSQRGYAMVEDDLGKGFPSEMLETTYKLRIGIFK